MSKHLFPVPISLHVFNRPETTQQVFDQIKQIQPRQLFITADGARDNVASDKEKCQAVRAIVSDIDWPCEVFKNFSSINKGSYKATSEGITWVFQHVERAIILEDDNVPHPTFFRFCQEMLDYYANDERVALISGNNFQLSGHKTPYSYYFSRYTHIWGWATWKRTWDKVDFNMQHWPEFRDMRGLDAIFSRWHERQYWYQFYQAMYEGKKGPHWDYQLLLSTYMNHSLTVLPNNNLITNIGFGEDAANCKTKSNFHALSTKAMSFPLEHPPFVSRYVDADDFTEKTIFSGGLKKYVKMKLISYLPDYLRQALKKMFFYKK